MPLRRDIQQKYRGTVLVMVVGLLVMLFVMGTSFLFVSRFERRMTEEMLVQSGGTGGSGGGAGTGDSVVVLRRLLETIRGQLRKDAVGLDGIPYNADLNGDAGAVREDFWDAPGWFDVDDKGFSVILKDRDGGQFEALQNLGKIPFPRSDSEFTQVELQDDEIGDGLLASNEPYADPYNMAYSRPLWTWFAVSSFTDNRPRLSHQVVQYPDEVNANARAAKSWLLPWYPGAADFVTDRDRDGDNIADRAARERRYDLYHTEPKVLETAGLLPDADGDGYPDFLFATRDRDADNNETGATPVPPAELWPDEVDGNSYTSTLDIDQKVALRVISHGGMVLLDRDVPRTLLLAATAEPGTTSIQHIVWPDNGEELEPSIEEVNLRRRNCLPTPYDANDVGGPTDKRTEFERNNRQWLETTDGEGDPRWYPLAYDDQEANGGNQIADVGDQTYFEDKWMTATDSRYDRRHLVTTISYDDLYRPNRSEGSIGWDFTLPSTTLKIPRKLGDYIFVNQNDPTKRYFVPGVLREIGRAQTAVTYLPDEGLEPLPDDVLRYSYEDARSVAGRTQFSLADLDETERVYTKGQQVRLLYAFYRAMLEDTTVGKRGDPTETRKRRSEQAAMLAVNTWDFFDSNAVPTVASMMGDDLDVMDLNADGITYGADLERNVLGIEGLPFLTQVYVGGKYKTEPPESAGEFNVQAYAIELFNPWPAPIILTPTNFKIGLMPIPTTITIPAAQTPGLLNPGTWPSNLAIISSMPIPGVQYVVGKDIRDMIALTIGTSVSISYTVRGTTYVIDSINPNDGDSQNFSASFEWPTPDNDPQEAGNYKAVSLVRGTTNVYNNNAWLYALGRERDVDSTVSGGLPLLGLGQGDVGPTGFRPVPIFTSDSGEPGTVFPCTGMLLLVSRYAHLAYASGIGAACFADQTVADVDLADGTKIGWSNNKPLEKRIDNGHMPVFDQDQYAGIEDDENKAKIRVPWGQLVFSYFTAMPLQRMNLDGTPEDYDGDEHYNRPSTSWPEYRQAYDNLLQRYTLFSLDPNAGLPVPIVERVPARDGYAYGPRVRGRININTAPWSVLDGVPLIQYFNTSNVGPIPVIDRAINDILNLGSGASPIDADLTISPQLARSIVAYREARRVWEGSADYRDRATTAGLPARDVLQGVGAMREGPGFVTVGELANLVHGWAPPNYKSGDSAYRIDAWDGSVSFNDFSHAIAILASLPDWLTVKSNTYTMYATVVDAADEVEATRGQWTLDRTRCLYQSDRTSAGLPQIIGPEVIVDYADAAADPE